MTTIATDGRSMAADGRMTLGDMIIKEDVDKICKVEHEESGEMLLVGIAGCVAWKDEFIEFARSSYLGDGSFLGTRLVLTPESDEVAELRDPATTRALILTQQGRVFMVLHGEPILEVSKCQAIGSGSEFAIGALLAGKTPGESVIIASKVDVNTNSVVQEIHIGKR